MYPGASPSPGIQGTERWMRTPVSNGLKCFPQACTTSCCVFPYFGRWELSNPSSAARTPWGQKKKTGNHPVPGSQPWKQSSVFQKTSLFFLTMWRISRFTFPWLDSGEGSINSWQVSLCGFYMNVVFPVHVTVPGAGTEQKNSLLPWRARLSKATQ